MAIGRRILMRMFGCPSGLLGRVGGLILARTNRQAAETAIELLAVRPGDCVLEIGFGPGVGIAILAERARSGRVAGVDPSAEMVRQAMRRNAQAIEAGRVDLRRAGADQLPFPDGAFDKALAVNSMQIWPDPAAGMREVRRVLKPGGQVVLGFTPFAGQSNDAVEAAIAAAGFAPASIIEREGLHCVIASKAWKR
jgi:ubiquinone/menaquinone biosynthesis C-methylase UbiE